MTVRDRAAFRAATVRERLAELRSLTVAAPIRLAAQSRALILVGRMHQLFESGIGCQVLPILF